MNNSQIIIEEGELEGFVKYGQNYLSFTRVNGVQEIYPLIHIKNIERVEI